MRFIGKLFYFLFYALFFSIFAFIAMFLGGVSGTASTFYIMIEKGDMQQNLTIAIAALSVLWLIVIMLSSHNKKVLKRNKLLAATEKEKTIDVSPQSDAEKIAQLMAQNNQKKPLGN